MISAANLLEKDLDLASDMIVREIGRPVVAARAEVLKCANGMRFYAEHAEAFLADQPLQNPGSVHAASARTSFQPLGVVFAVMPWNYPLWQVIRFAAPALMAGNAGLLKHASNVPLSALYLDTLFYRARFPEGAFSTLLIGSADVAAVVTDPRVSAVTLTGSEPAGRAVGALAAAHVKRAALELGGSDPFIVMPSTDVNAAVNTAVRARLVNAGQSFIAAKRFLVHQDIYDEFAGRFAKVMSEVILGNPALEDTQLGLLSTSSGRDELVKLVEDANLQRRDHSRWWCCPRRPRILLPGHRHCGRDPRHARSRRRDVWSRRHPLPGTRY